MRHEIIVDGSSYIIDETYVISGDYEEGYDVKKYDDGTQLYSSLSFENCLIWCFNS